MEVDREVDPSRSAQLSEPQTSQQAAMPPPATTAVQRSSVPPQALMSALTPASGEPTLAPTLQRGDKKNPSFHEIITSITRNVVSTVNLGCVLDLMKINFSTRNSEYNPSRFCGIVMRLREPHTTALLFKSGKVVVTGAKSEDCAQLAARKYARIVQKLGFPVSMTLFLPSSSVYNFWPGQFGKIS
nr:unnamed protein product [Timema californicum]